MYSNKFAAKLMNIRRLCKENVQNLSIFMVLSTHYPTFRIKQITNEEAEIIANVEHNRWNVEKLLLGYRKPSESEDANAPVNYVNGMKSGAMKEAHKALFIHSDIRPFSSLDQIQTIDKEIVRYIPWLQDIAKSNSYN